MVVRWYFKMLFSAEPNVSFTLVLLSNVDPLFIACTAHTLAAENMELLPTKR